MTRWTTTLALSLICAVPQFVFGQSLADVRKPYDSGQYQQAITLGAQSDEARIIYVVAQSHQKLAHADDARAAYEKLASRPESDPWRGVGRSALALLSANATEALEAANEAIKDNGDLAEAHYQRGLALSAKQEMPEAAAAFQKATDLDPDWAYAHYYAGIAYSKVKRADLTASHFRTFLNLAPKAPERAQVQSILKTLGG